MNYRTMGAQEGRWAQTALRNCGRCSAPITRCQSKRPSSNATGRAGGPVGAQAVSGDSKLHELNVLEPIRIPNVHGRAGVPLPFQN